MLVMCPYCKQDTAGNHQSGCPNNPVKIKKIDEYQTQYIIPCWNYIPQPLNDEDLLKQDISIILNLTDTEIDKLPYVELKEYIGICSKEIDKIKAQYQPLIEPIEKIYEKLYMELDYRNWYRG